MEIGVLSIDSRIYVPPTPSPLKFHALIALVGAVPGPEVATFTVLLRMSR